MKVYVALKSPPWPRLHPFFFFVFYSFCVPFSNVNGNTVAEESRLFFIPERADLISLTILSQTLMHYTVGQQFIVWPCMYASNVRCERERENEGTWNMNKCFNVSLTSFLCSHWRLFVFLFSVYVIMYSWHICSPFGLSPFCTPTWIQLWKTDPYLLLWLCGAQLNVDNSKGICIEMSYKLPPVFLLNAYEQSVWLVVKWHCIGRL